MFRRWRRKTRSAHDPSISDDFIANVTEVEEAVAEPKLPNIPIIIIHFLLSIIRLNFLATPETKTKRSIALH